MCCINKSEQSDLVHKSTIQFLKNSGVQDVLELEVRKIQNNGRLNYVCPKISFTSNYETSDFEPRLECDTIVSNSGERFTSFS